MSLVAHSLSILCSKVYKPPVDSEMCKTAIEHKIELLKQLESVLHGTVKPSKPPCSLPAPPLSVSGGKAVRQ